MNDAHTIAVGTARTCWPPSNMTSTHDVKATRFRTGGVVSFADPDLRSTRIVRRGDRV